MSSRKNLRTRLKRYLVAGILIWVPAVVTFLILRFIIDLIDRIILVLPEAYRPESLLLVTGFLAANIVGRRLVARWESLVARIPLVSPIYGGAKKVSETLLSDQGQAFRKVLLVEYPRRGIWSLAFLTAAQLGEVQAKTGKEVACVFVPTTPNPTSGFIIMVPRDEIVVLDMSVDEAFRMIVSLGVVVPDWPAKTAKLPALSRSDIRSNSVQTE
jgi:uncharacterized membrane protein